MIRPFDNIRQAYKDRQLTKLYEAAVHERAMTIAPQILQESAGNTPDIIPMIIGKSMFAKEKPAGRALSRYIMEKRRIPTNRVIFNTMVMRSPYQYSRIDSFYNKESYFSRSLIRQIETMMKNGYDFTSEDPDMLALTRQEFSRIQMDSGMPLNQLLFTMGMNLLKYGIVIIHKVRERVKDTVAPDDRRRSRITRLRIVKPHTASLYINSAGKVIGIWDGNPNFISQNTQTISLSQTQQFMGISAEDIMIGYMSDPGDDIFPEPPCFQMLDDILTLRSIEETVELLCFQYGSPLLHAQVGSETYLPSPNEIADVNAQLVNVAPNGMITTDFRVKIDVISIQKGIANIIPFLDHFKNRVLMGSGSSPISVGEGNTSNRSTADSIDDALADHCTYLANAICDPINHNIVPDLLVRADTTWEDKDLFDDNGELNVKLEFNETRLEKQIARSNNIINLWEGNLLKFSEARRMLKRGPLAPKDESELYVNKVQIPLKEAGPAPAIGADPGGTVSKKTMSQNQPTNQHGTKAGPGSTKN